MSVLLESNLPNLFHRGKVRDTYTLGGDLLMVATDRVSAFDVVLPTGIPDKGKVLNLLSAFWFGKTSHIVPNHVLEVVEDVRVLTASLDHKKLGRCFIFPSYLAGRSMIVKKAERIPVECVVRGYISGSAWAEYKEKGTVNSAPLPKGLRESEKLEKPIFTPTTKADSGHDEPMTPAEVAKLIGKKVAEEVTEKSLAVYRFAQEYARERGIILADTKMEFGISDGKVILIDELLTPDSSRFWDEKSYEVGHSQPSFDKQPLRDWLEASGWNKSPPAPELPPDVVEAMADRYREAYRRLTGETIWSEE